MPGGADVSRLPPRCLRNQFERPADGPTAVARSAITDAGAMTPGCMERRATVHDERRALGMRQHEHRMMKGRILAPPLIACVADVRTRASMRTMFVMLLLFS